MQSTDAFSDMNGELMFWGPVAQQAAPAAESEPRVIVLRETTVRPAGDMNGTLRHWGPSTCSHRAGASLLWALSAADDFEEAA